MEQPTEGFAKQRETMTPLEATVSSHCRWSAQMQTPPLAPPRQAYPLLQGHTVCHNSCSSSRTTSLSVCLVYVLGWQCQCVSHSPNKSGATVREVSVLFEMFQAQKACNAIDMSSCKAKPSHQHECGTCIPGETLITMCYTGATWQAAAGGLGWQ